MNRRRLLTVLALGALWTPLAVAEPPLEGVEWRLVQLGRRGIPPQPGRRRDPYLMFDAAGRMVAGFAGCNHVRGPYQREGERLEIGRLAATRMACTTGYELETYLLRTLRRVRRWRIEAGVLELLDEQGQVLARFERVN